MAINLTDSVGYHYGKFPPTLNYAKLIAALTRATDALSRYDQMLKNLHIICTLEKARSGTHFKNGRHN
jgi:hypothetical protein